MASTTAKSRAWVDVDLAALRANLRAIVSASGPGSGVVPMVKADAYGLGMERVAAAVVEELAGRGPWAFGVAAVAEGEALRSTGWEGRIIVFVPTGPQEVDRAASADLTLAVSSLDGLCAWADAARRSGRRLAFHAEVDTGMGRAGLPWIAAAEWGPVVAEIAGETLRWEGCFTHFHSADEPELAATDEQWSRFQRAVETLPPDPARVLHVANSAAAARRGGYGCDLIRPGIFLYGGNVGGSLRPSPVASLHARLALVRNVPPGSTVGYGATHTASGPERWGTASLGYGDGLRRSLASGGGEALVRGRRVPIVGRISMDMVVLHLSTVPDAAVGDVVTFFGTGDGGEIPLDEVASRAGTISYEILTGLGTRLPRIYR